MNETQTLQAREQQEVQEESTRPRLRCRPDIDIIENRDGYVIYADLPGVDDKSVEVKLDRGKLSLEARLATTPDRSWNPLHMEYRVGSYHREFRISEDIDPAGVAAKMNNGVLELVLPRSAERRPRAIQVQAG